MALYELRTYTLYVGKMEKPALFRRHSRPYGQPETRQRIMPAN
jgi:hypothetical protein